MRTLLLLLVLFTGLSNLNAQTFGIAYYKVPAGWQVVQQSPNLVLEQQRGMGKPCQIVLSATEEIVVDNEKSFRNYRDQKKNEGFRFDDAGIRKENEYSIAYISQASGMDKNAKQKMTFYSFTNKKASFYVQFISDGISCQEVFDSFIKSLEIEDGTTQMADQDKNSRTSKPRGRPRKNPA